MRNKPDVVIVVDQQREINAVRECLKLGIPLVTFLDTNCDPTLTDFLFLEMMIQFVRLSYYLVN
jgi:ribosomal protein S2